MLDKTRWTYVTILVLGWLGIALLSGCVGPSGPDVSVVHLHADTMSRSERIALRNALRKEGFAVKLRDNPTPFEVNTLIYSPFIGSENHIERARLAMSSAGYAPKDLILRQAKNHHYTPGHLGLYMVGDQAEVASGAQAALEEVPFNLPDAEFWSHECESLYFMEFSHDGAVAVAHIDDETPEVLGWSEVDNSVTLTSDKATYSYEKIIDTSRDGERVTFSILLMPTEEHPGLYGCDYLGRTQVITLEP